MLFRNYLYYIHKGMMKQELLIMKSLQYFSSSTILPCNMPMHMKEI